MTFLPLTSYSDFPTYQTFNQFHDPDTELGLHRITSGFVSMEHSQRVWHASREPFRTLGSVPLRPVFPNLSGIFSTFRLGYPSVLFQFCFWYTFHILKIIYQFIGQLLYKEGKDVVGILLTPNMIFIETDE